MEGQLPQASVPAADSHRSVRSNLSNFPADSGDVVLRLLHTADWHLGRRFPSFPEEAQKKLSRARMNVIANILDVARCNAVHALLCAGDLFDDPEPEPDLKWTAEQKSRLAELAEATSGLLVTPTAHLSGLKQFAVIRWKVLKPDS